MRISSTANRPGPTGPGPEATAGRAGGAVSVSDAEVEQPKPFLMVDHDVDVEGRVPVVGCPVHPQRVHVPPGRPSAAPAAGREPLPPTRTARRALRNPHPPGREVTPAHPPAAHACPGDGRIRIRRPIGAAKQLAGKETEAGSPRRREHPIAANRSRRNVTGWWQRDSRTWPMCGRPAAYRCWPAERDRSSLSLRLCSAHLYAPKSSGRSISVRTSEQSKGSRRCPDLPRSGARCPHVVPSASRLRDLAS